MLAIFETGVRCHVYHALALLAVARVADKNPESRERRRLGLHPRDRRLFRKSLHSQYEWHPLARCGDAYWSIALLVGWVLLFLAAAR